MRTCEGPVSACATLPGWLSLTTCLPAETYASCDCGSVQSAGLFTTCGFSGKFCYFDLSLFFRIVLVPAHHRFEMYCPWHSWLELLGVAELQTWENLRSVPLDRRRHAPDDHETLTLSRRALLAISHGRGYEQRYILE